MGYTSAGMDGAISCESTWRLIVVRLFHLQTNELLYFLVIDIFRLVQENIESCISSRAERVSKFMI